MNWLAHIFLSEKSIDFQIGNYLADPLKGRVWEGSSQEIKKGMSVHKIIDSYTDSHTLFLQSKARLGDKGLLKALIIDLTYDYLLTKNWHHFCNEDIETFLDSFYSQAIKTLPHLPLHASQPLKRMVEFDLLNKYQNLTHLREAFERIDKRLSTRLAKRDTASAYFHKVSQNIDCIEEDFMLFFPQLCQKTKEHMDKNRLTHWKI
ncbi:MAG: ACP phosphodiesterase [Candidatus Marinarcus sp.]|uniref:ACP phosphodiesterase n=1 Tax=Candidatus Marinarcus sp. TaxID=3100987 RepID=UPI003AFFE9FD